MKGRFADKNGKFEEKYPNNEGGMNWIYISGLKPHQKICCATKGAKKQK